MSRGDKAYELFTGGYNCAQAVVGAFADVIGMDFDAAIKLSSGFGGGIGRMREVCGTFSGIVIVMNALYGCSDPRDSKGRAELYSRIQELAAAFRRDNGSIICRELLGLSKPENPPAQAQHKKRPCSELCRYAADLLENYLAENPKAE